LLVIHNRELNGLIRPSYSLSEVRAISDFLHDKGTLSFTSLPNGLFPAAALGSGKSYTGYSYVWVRDNVHVAHAHYRTGHTQIAVKNLQTLMVYFVDYKHRFLDIIDGSVDPSIPMNRPHIRFQGASLKELDRKWAHAQNDALGYFLWIFSRLVNDRAITPSTIELEMLAIFVRYFEAIRYWEDEDSGHWEETRKVSASSIGVVVAGLTEYSKIQRDLEIGTPAPVTLATVERLVQRGREAMMQILPAECIQPDPTKQRPYDAALLFLIYPLQIVESEMALQILANVQSHLQGEIGIRRYLGDSYWAPDYRKKLKPAERAADYSDDVSGRDALLPAPGLEAQWCIFDPIVSCIYGAQFTHTRSAEDLTGQVRYFNRSLAQITSADQNDVSAFRCPELYYLESGNYVPNDHVPLLWTQANLMLALKFMEESCSS
jgi:glycosyl hydrolase family 15